MLVLKKKNRTEVTYSIIPKQVKGNEKLFILKLNDVRPQKFIYTVKCSVLANHKKNLKRIYSEL